MEQKKKYIIPSDFFDKRQNYKFEECYFQGPKEYDEYLKCFYGDDYMTPVKYAHISDYSKVIIK